MGLMLAGMLVDPAVVVLESIFRRRQEDGWIASAVLIGSREVGMAVLASSDDDLRICALLFLSDSRSAADARCWCGDLSGGNRLNDCGSIAHSAGFSVLFRDGVERYDAYLKMFISVGIGAIYWRAGDVGWEAWSLGNE